jgi:hypothetical protein
LGSRAAADVSMTRMVAGTLRSEATRRGYGTGAR